MKPFFVSITMVLLCGTAMDSVVTEFLSSIDQKFEDRRSLRYVRVDQIYFDNADFLLVDTSGSLLHPTPLSWVPLRIAVDEDANVYQLFNFDAIQYNDLVARAPLALGAEDIRPYGQFYLDITQLWDPEGYTYLPSTEWFIEANQFRRKEVLKRDPFLYGRDGGNYWPDLEIDIQKMFAGFEWNRLVWTDRDSVYEADYMVWMECTGALRHFRLMIHPDGRCDEAIDSVWSESFGYYTKYRE